MKALTQTFPECSAFSQVSWSLKHIAHPTNIVTDASLLLFTFRTKDHLCIQHRLSLIRGRIFSYTHLFKLRIEKQRRRNNKSHFRLCI